MVGVSCKGSPPLTHRYSASVEIGERSDERSEELESELGSERNKLGGAKRGARKRQRVMMGMRLRRKI